MNDNEQPIPALLAEQAAQWVVAMRRDDAERSRDAFERWRDQSSEHRIAYERMLLLFDQSAVLKSAPVLPVAAPPRRRGWLWTAGAAAAAAAALAVALPWQSSGPPTRRESPSLAASDMPLSTPHGQIRTFRLADGTRVTLDADSSAAIRMTASQRGLRLDQGRARVVIARDPRPFALEAGGGAIVASAAAVDVGFQDDGAVEVRLIAGDASLQQLRPRTAAYLQMDGAPLAVDRPVAIAQRGFAPRPVGTAQSDTRDWPSGWAEYRSIPLGALIEQANRYADRPIHIDEPAIAAMQVSGRFRLTDTRTFLSGISGLFSLEVVERADGYHLRRK